MNENLHFEVIPESLKEMGTIMHGVIGEYQGKPVVFMYDSSVQDIIIPESLEPIYPAIEEAVVRYLRQSGRLK
ncbi:MAG: hypothetical protein K2J37_07110 [Ruminococcus sp.]|nr:hypothetical protein [Ruminococcus sp.]MDE6784641.1 hypothetical protein [Ruminococcus sp.]